MFDTKEKGKVFVGLSGGVDSAVSAALLQQQGYDVTGVFIRITIPGYPCTAGEDKIDAQRVAAHLRIPFIEIDLSEEYKKEVFDNTVSEFAKGNTPNPDTLCNQKIKFGAFYNFAKSHGADFIATGHYARLVEANSNVAGLRSATARGHEQISSKKFAYPETVLFAGSDSDKDQSYFLWMVPETVLRYTLFPVGSLHKTEVRTLAKKFSLPNATRRDSQGLCFLGDISIDDMLVRELAPAPGNMVSETGETIGTHRGAALYTLGQRHGFELFEQTGEAHYVIAKDAKKNTITVSTSPFPQGVSKTTLELASVNWIGGVENKPYEARYRYRQKLIPAELQNFKKVSKVILQEPHYAPAGQSLVLYDGERCVGGGIIESASVF